MPIWEALGRPIVTTDGPASWGSSTSRPTASPTAAVRRLEDAVAHGAELVDEGADLLDVGGESSRPGAEPVPVAEELRRVMPVIEALAARVACRSRSTRPRPRSPAGHFAAGASIVNDIHALAG